MLKNALKLDNTKIYIMQKAYEFALKKCLNITKSVFKTNANINDINK